MSVFRCFWKIGLPHFTIGFSHKQKTGGVDDNLCDPSVKYPVVCSLNS